MKSTDQSRKTDPGRPSAHAASAEAPPDSGGRTRFAGVNLSGVLRRFKAAFGGWLGEGPRETAEDLDQLRTLCQRALARRGEVSSIVLVAKVADAYQRMTSEEKLEFFRMLAVDFPVDPARLESASAAYLDADGTRIAEITALNAALESPRLVLLRLFNTISGGIKFLIDLRADLLAELAGNPELTGVEFDLRQLLSSWFNIGFLDLERITWETPAAVLEKLIDYEAVHQINGWDDLKHRLTSSHTAFAFFHPAMPGEPVIFVEAAIVEGLADNIQTLINPESENVAPEKADTAIFYSISNAQKGLRGIPLGNFLIKQVLAKLRVEFPHLTTFATLSPMPGFRRGFLEPELAQGTLSRFYEKGEAAALCDATQRNSVEEALAAVLDNTSWASDERLAAALRPGLLRAARHYLTEVRKDGGESTCPVAHFHASNGAVLGRINWMGDFSAKGLRQSAGMMVNYVYDPSQYEQAQQAYVQQGQLKVSKEVQSL